MKVIGSVPFHVPLSAETVLPTRGVPVTLGAVTLPGAVPTTGAVRSLVADAEPRAFVAVTTTWMRLPASAAVGV